MMRRPRLVVGSVVATVLVVSSSVAGPTAAAVPTSPRQACADTQTSTISFGSRGVRRAKEVVYDEGRTYEVNRRTVRSDRRVSRIDLRVVACKDPETRAWKALEVTPAATHYDLDHYVSGDRIKPAPRSGAYGWGVYTRSVGSRSAGVWVRVCQREPRTLSWIGVSRAVTVLPWPGRYAVKVGRYVASKALPPAADPKYWCGVIGSSALTWTYGSAGRALHTDTVPVSARHVRSYPCRTMSPSVDSCQDQHTTTVSFTRF